MDDHAVWLQRLSNFAAVAEGVVIFVIGVILFSAITTVIFTTRTSLAIHHDVVEVLHLIGAHDSYVAQQFQAHALRLGSEMGKEFGRGLLQQLARLLTPGGLHHLGNAVDHHVQEAAHQQAEQHANQDQGGRVGRQVVEKQHR